MGFENLPLGTVRWVVKAGEREKKRMVVDSDDELAKGNQMSVCCSVSTWLMRL